MTAFLILQGVEKRFGALKAVDRVTIEVGKGEFFSILGPSGCGKTTLLRMIAGFELPSGGSIQLNGRDLTGVAAQERGIGMVFQNYALFPHMTVWENVAFGLRTRRLPEADIASRVERVLEAVHLSGKTLAPVPELSGGEQQRVAVARALVIEPALLLCDEPLSNLDVALRLETREEIRRLQRTTGITTVYVTHDQSEAMALSDRIAVMRAGAVEQIGAPAEIYEAPRTPFVAQFLGGGNLLDVTVEASPALLVAGGLRLPLPASLAASHLAARHIALKPEAIIVPAAPGHAVADGVIEDLEYLGFTTHCVLRVAGHRLSCTLLSSEKVRGLAVGQTVPVEIDWSRCTFF